MKKALFLICPNLFLFLFFLHSVGSRMCINCQALFVVTDPGEGSSRPVHTQLRGLCLCCTTTLYISTWLVGRRPPKCLCHNRQYFSWTETLNRNERQSEDFSVGRILYILVSTTKNCGVEANCVWTRSQVLDPWISFILRHPSLYSLYKYRYLSGIKKHTKAPVTLHLKALNKKREKKEEKKIRNTTFNQFESGVPAITEGFREVENGRLLLFTRGCYDSLWEPVRQQLSVRRLSWCTWGLHDNQNSVTWLWRTISQSIGKLHTHIHTVLCNSLWSTFRVLCLLTSSCNILVYGPQTWIHGETAVI